MTSSPTFCASCGSDPHLAGRYRLDEVVGSGSSGTVIRALDTTTGEVVAVKEMPFRIGDPEKIRERVARETRVLRELHHPQLPRWRDEIIAGQGRSRALFLVQDFVEGESIAQESARRRYSEMEVLDILAEVLEVLVYLHELQPPVIHRDIKPGNLIRRASDGRLVLVDLGAVRDVLRDQQLGGSTVAGTFGYMAPEQFRGHAEPATDLFGTGALAVALLSRQDPSTLHDRSGQFLWKDAVSVSPRTRALLEALLEPDPGRRLGDARTALKQVRRARIALEEDRLDRVQGDHLPQEMPGVAPYATPPDRVLPEPEIPEPLARRPDHRALQARRRPSLASSFRVLVLVFLVAGVLAGGAHLSGAMSEDVAPRAPEAPVSPRRGFDREGLDWCDGPKVDLTNLPRVGQADPPPGWQAAKVTVSHSPVFPDEAKRSWPSGQQLRCEVLFVVDADGGSPEAVAVPAEGCPDAFRQSICDTGRYWEFEPALQEGKPTRSAYKLGVTFTLK